MVKQATDEKRPPANGSAVASPRTTATPDPERRRPRAAARPPSSSTATSRGTRTRRASVTSPGPAPTSSTWSPSRRPPIAQGSRTRSTVSAHSALAQNRRCSAFIRGGYRSGLAAAGAGGSPVGDGGVIMRWADPGRRWLAWRRLRAPGRRLAERSRGVRPTAVGPGRSAASPALLEDAVERLARARLGEVVQEQDDAGDRQ